VTTLAAFRLYHEREAQLWERQALIKARPIAGDRALCEALETARVEIVWGRPPPADAAAEIARLRARMERELAGESAGVYNPKLGRGGLVDIEFMVQFHQLMIGSANPSVRQRGTLEALDALARAQRIDARTHDTLRDAHGFLRRLENRLRIVHDRPQSELRAEPALELEQLARRMGYRGLPGEVGSRLLDDYATITRDVRDLFEQMLDQGHGPHDPAR
jgi:glutamate-ammonia-ligase adenylyltransferase